MKKQPTEREKIFANHINDKQLEARISKELSKLNGLKNKSPVKKWPKHLNKHFIKEEDRQKARRRTKGDAQRPEPSGRRNMVPSV